MKKLYERFINVLADAEKQFEQSRKRMMKLNSLLFEYEILSN